MQKQFQKFPEEMTNTEEHKKAVKMLKETQADSMKNAETLEVVLEDTKELIRKSGYLNEKEMEEFFNATDKMISITKKIIMSAIEDPKEYNELVDEYLAIEEVIKYWDQEYERREAKFKINGIKNNTIH
jgi:hypothetical protein